MFPPQCTDILNSMQAGPPGPTAPAPQQEAILGGGRLRTSGCHPWGAFKHTDCQFQNTPQFTTERRSGKRVESRSHREGAGEEERGRGSTQKAGRRTAEFQAPRWKK